MPFLFLSLPVILQIICIVHVLKTGRDRYWIYLIFFIPLVGGAAYFFVEIMPDLLNQQRRETIKESLIGTISPGWKMRQLERQVRFSPTFENKVALAHVYLGNRMFDEAIGLYKKCLEGVFANDTELLEHISAAYFYKEDFENAREYLEKLQKTGNGLSEELLLLYARTQEMLGEETKAEKSYRTSANSYSGLEAKCRLALFLKKAGKNDEANALFADMLETADYSPAYFRRREREWITIAKSHVGG